MAVDKKTENWNYKRQGLREGVRAEIQNLDDRRLIGKSMGSRWGERPDAVACREQDILSLLVVYKPAPGSPLQHT